MLGEDGTAILRAFCEGTALRQYWHSLGMSDGSRSSGIRKGRNLDWLAARLTGNKIDGSVCEDEPFRNLQDRHWPIEFAHGRANACR
jgi:hypothetical protein